LLPYQFSADYIIVTRGYNFREGQRSSRWLLALVVIAAFVAGWLVAHVFAPSMFP
jgi:hypothetical protein